MRGFVVWWSSKRGETAGYGYRLLSLRLAPARAVWVSPDALLPAYKVLVQSTPEGSCLGVDERSLVLASWILGCSGIHR